MIIESVITTVAELNTGSNVIKTVKIPIMTKAQSNFASDVNFRTTGIEVLNSTGALVKFVPMTEKEYLVYSGDASFSDYIPVANDGTKVLDNLRGVIKYLIIKGAGSGHTTNLEIIMYKEANF